MTDKKIIIIDDSIINLKIAANALKNDYQVFTASSGEKLSQFFGKIMPDLILLDIEMPDKNGFEVFEDLKANEKTALIPVAFITSSDSVEYEKRAYEMGAIDYIRKPFYPAFLCKKIGMHFQLDYYQAQTLRYEQKIQTSESNIANMQAKLLNTVIDLVARRNEVSGGHAERMRLYMEVLLDVLIKNGIYGDIVASWEKDLLLNSAVFYDLGKISVMDSILMKPDKLDKEEYTEVKKHTVAGVKIIDDIRSKLSENSREANVLEYAKEFAAYHHEKWDGTGYPNGLKGYNIPLPGRLMAIADVYDALISERAYNKAYTPQEAAEIISQGKGTHFDPILVDVFITVADKFSQIARQRNPG